MKSDTTTFEGTFDEFLPVIFAHIFPKNAHSCRSGNLCEGTYLIELPSKSRIMNSIKPQRVQYILRHFYYATMQKLCKFKALYRPEIQCNCHKDSP